MLRKFENILGIIDRAKFREKCAQKVISATYNKKIECVTSVC